MVYLSREVFMVSTRIATRRINAKYEKQENGKTHNRAEFPEMSKDVMTNSVRHGRTASR